MPVDQGKDPSVFLDGIRSLLVTIVFFSASQAENLGAILSGVAFLPAEETLHTRRL